MDIKNLNIWKTAETDEEKETIFILADYRMVNDYEISKAAREAASRIMKAQLAAKGIVLDETAVNGKRPVFMKYIAYKLKRYAHAGVSELDLSVRAFNSLNRAGIHNIGDLLARVTAQGDIGFIKQCGDKCKNEILWKLFDYQFRFLLKENRDSYIERCSHACDPEKRAGIAFAEADQTIREIREMKISFQCFNTVTLIPEETEMVGNLKQEIHDTCFKYPLYVTEELTATPIEDMSLTNRPYHCLKRAGIGTVKDLIQRVTDGMEIYQIRNCGVKSTEEILTRLFFINLESMTADRKEDFIRKVAAMNAEISPT